MADKQTDHLTDKRLPPPIGCICVNTQQSYFKSFISERNNQAMSFVSIMLRYCK